MGVSPSKGCDGGFGITVGQDLCLPPTEHSCTVHRNQAHYGPVSGGGEIPGDKVVQAMVLSGGAGLVGDLNGGSAGGTGGEGGGWGGYGYRRLGGRILYKT